MISPRYMDNNSLIKIKKYSNCKNIINISLPYTHTIENFPNLIDDEIYHLQI